ncbi:MAG: GYD domain-containing protein [Vicinamibacterales bacterium]
MPKYLIKVAYNVDGVRGLLKEGGVARRETVSKLVAAMGGTMESFYYAFGDDDAYVIVDLPSQTDGLALTLAVNAGGAVRLTTTPLIDPEDIDIAAKKTVAYRAPGA